MEHINSLFPSNSNHKNALNVIITAKVLKSSYLLTIFRLQPKTLTVKCNEDFRYHFKVKIICQQVKPSHISLNTQKHFLHSISALCKNVSSNSTRIKYHHPILLILQKIHRKTLFSSVVTKTETYTCQQLSGSLVWTKKSDKQGWTGNRRLWLFQPKRWHFNPGMFFSLNLELIYKKFPVRIYRQPLKKKKKKQMTHLRTQIKYFPILLALFFIIIHPNRLRPWQLKIHVN